jgi:hypothetical protein
MKRNAEIGLFTKSSVFTKFMAAYINHDTLLFNVGNALATQFPTDLLEPEIA